MKTVAIFSESWAALNQLCAGQKYRPSNGTEGAIFMEAWCGECQRDKSMREGAPLEECDDSERCDIIADTFAYDINDPKYPIAWQYGKDGQPRCTAFVPAGQPILVKDEHTVDMFETATSTDTIPSQGGNQ